MDNSLSSLLGYGGNADADGGNADFLSLYRAPGRAERKLEASRVTPRDGETVIAYIDRVFEILDGYGRADRRADANRGIRAMDRPAPGPAPAPTVRVQRRSFPIPTGTPDDVIDYIDEHLSRADARAARVQRERERAAKAPNRGNGAAVGGTSRIIPGQMTPERRIQRDIELVARIWDKRETLDGQARAPYTRRLRELVRSLIARGLTLDQIIERASDVD